jgi:hypothetical protein
MARSASPVALNWVRFFGHLCTFIGFFEEKLGSFRNSMYRPRPSPFDPVNFDYACPAIVSTTADLTNLILVLIVILTFLP